MEEKGLENEQMQKEVMNRERLRENDDNYALNRDGFRAEKIFAQAEFSAIGQQLT